MTSPMDRLQVTRTQRDHDTYEYAYTVPENPTLRLPGHVISRAELEQNLLLAATLLRRWGEHGDESAGEQSFTNLGSFLRDRYLPEAVLEYLFASQEPLVIETSDPEFPWELVRYNGQFLGIHRPIGRQIPHLSQPVYGVERWGKDRHALLVGNPTGDLAIAEQEVNELTEKLRAYRDPSNTPHPHPYHGKPLVQSEASIEQVEQWLRDRGVEFFHFAGHATYDRQNHGASGLTLAGGVPLTADLLRTWRAEFAYVFLNCCEAGRAAQPHGPRLHSLADGAVLVDGLAAAFIEGGAAAFISTLWPVFDESAHRFASAFYQLALGGESLGEALRQARDEWRKKRPKDPTWAAYILYGDPRLTIESVRDPDQRELEATHQHRTLLPLAISSGEVTPEARIRLPREEEFFRRCVPNVRISLGVSGRAVIERTLAWVDLMRWAGVARLDLLVGLALIPEGLVERGLRALGSSPEQVGRINAAIFGVGKRTADQPNASQGVKTALERAARAAEAADRAEVTEEDIAVGLLDLPSASGSLQMGLGIIGCDGQTLLAAARGQPLDQLLLTQRGPRSQIYSDPTEAAAKRDATPRRALLDLKAKVEGMLRGSGVPPLVGRERELLDVLRVLTQPQRPHVVIRGPAGVGSRALALHIAVKLVTDPSAAEVARIANWKFYAVNIGQPAAELGGWLVEEIGNLGGDPTILLLEDLPALLAFEGMPAVLQSALRHPNLRLLATAHTDDFRAVMRHPEISAALTPIDLKPPYPEVALPMAQAHLPRLERKYDLDIAPDAVSAAVALASKEAPYVLPGAAVQRLDRACAQVRTAGILTTPDNAPDALGSGEVVPRPPMIATLPILRPTVTADDVRAATPEPRRS